MVLVRFYAVFAVPEPHITAGIAKTSKTAKNAGIGTAGTASKNARIGTAGTAIEKSWNIPCLARSSYNYVMFYTPDGVFSDHNI